MDIEGVADALDGATRNALGLSLAVLVAELPPDLPALELALRNLEGELEHVAVARLRHLDRGVDNLGDVFTRRDKIEVVTFLIRGIENEIVHFEGFL